MAWDSVHLFECPTRVHYGAGAIAGLPAHLAELGLRVGRARVRPGAARRRHRRPGARDRGGRRRDRAPLHGHGRESDDGEPRRDRRALPRAGLRRHRRARRRQLARCREGRLGADRERRQRVGLPRARPRAAPRAARDLHPDDLRHRRRGHVRRRHHRSRPSTSRSCARRATWPRRSRSSTRSSC